MSPVSPRANATVRYLIGSPTSAFAISGLRLRVWPIPATIGLGLTVLIPGAFVNGWVAERMGAERSLSMPWLPHYVDHAAMLAIALLLIALLSRGRFSENGLQWPREKSYVMSAIAWGMFFGAAMTVVDYLPQILARAPPQKDLALTSASLFGWLGFEGFFVGFTEEIPFRGLLQTFLTQRTSGRVRFLKYEMHVAGVVLALLFALAHISSFWGRAFWPALGQQTYGFALGILYAYWREHSGSVMAPIIGHNVSDGIEYALVFLMAWLWC